MLSRVANAIYWLNVYIERAENYARFIDVNLNLTLDLPYGTKEQWDPLVSITGDNRLFQELFGPATKENVINFLAADPANPNSILSCLTAARENTRTVREIVSSEMWELVNKFYLSVKEAISSGRAIQNPHLFFKEVKQSSHLFAGVMDATMSHGEGWHFGRLGRLLERADKTSRILDVKYFILLPATEKVGTPFDNIQWSALLKSSSALEMYRKHYGPITPSHVAEFLLLNQTFPRSIRYCLIKAQESLQAITGSKLGTFFNTAEKRLGRLRGELDYSDINEIITDGLHEFLDEFQTRLNQVGDAIFETFFAMHPKDGMMIKGDSQ
ncbi:MAG: alpha-E domain-containing protein [Nitrospiria bacterium]